MTNPNLLDRVSTGDREAFVQLMREYGPALYFRLLDQLGDRTLADAAFRRIMLDFYRKLTASGEKDAVAALLVNEADAVSRGVRLLEVKTLGPSHPDAGYALTRRFYEKRGFLPLEETDLWGEGTPCLIMVKPLG